MKTMITVAALAAFLLPAGAALAGHSTAHGAKSYQSAQFRGAGAARAQANGRFAWAGSHNAVYAEGTYRGADPDPRVRNQLRRDVPAAY